MAGYQQGFAHVYNQRWAGFARRVAPLILDYHQSTSDGPVGAHLLDLCCGTGQFALAALERGYTVTGIDLSPHMLTHAQANTHSFMKSGRARFIRGDARSFILDRPADLIVCTFDALNHLESEADLTRTFRSVLAASADDGLFIFDLNTRHGLQQNWSGINVTDTEELALIQRGFLVPEQDRAYIKLTGFIRTDEGLYERFDEVLFNTAFGMTRVVELLRDVGWRQVHMARVEDLDRPLHDPEEEPRVYFVARR